MIKIRKGNTLVFALDRQNIDRLLDNQPITIDGLEFLMPGVQFLIVAGETLDDCKEDLRSIGVL